MAAGSGESPAPTVSVVIPTRNRRDSLELVLGALRHERCHEVIVVDDASADDTAPWLAAEARHRPELKLLSTPGVGPSPARAFGAEHATGDVVLFLDDDVVPAPGLVAGHARHHLRHERLVVSGYYPVASAPRLPATSRFLARAYERDVLAVRSDPSLGLLSLWGGLVSIRREDLRTVPVAISAFDGSLRHGDREFGLRCHKEGFRHVFDPGLVGSHRFSRTLAQFRDDARRSGFGAAQVALLHPDIAEPGGTPGSLPAAVAALLRMTDRPLGYGVATAALERLVLTGDALGLDRVADRALTALALVEKRRGERASLQTDRLS